MFYELYCCLSGLSENSFFALCTACCCCSGHMTSTANDPPRPRAHTRKNMKKKLIRNSLHTYIISDNI